MGGRGPCSWFKTRDKSLGHKLRFFFFALVKDINFFLWQLAKGLIAKVKAKHVEKVNVTAEVFLPSC